MNAKLQGGPVGIFQAAGTNVYKYNTFTEDLFFFISLYACICIMYKYIYEYICACVYYIHLILTSYNGNTEYMVRGISCSTRIDELRKKENKS